MKYNLDVKLILFWSSIFVLLYLGMVQDQADTMIIMIAGITMVTENVIIMETEEISDGVIDVVETITVEIKVITEEPPDLHFKNKHTRRVN